MLGEEVRPHQIPPKEPPTQAENLISAIQGKLGSHYYVDSRVKTVLANETGLLLFREISFVRRGLLGSGFRSQTLLTLITDSQPIREIEKPSKTREMLGTPPTRVDGWVSQDGRNLVNQTLEPDDIPADLQAMLRGVTYFATTEIFTYIRLTIPVQNFLSDKLTEAEKG